jgi:hypothetical protein
VAANANRKSGGRVKRFHPPSSGRLPGSPDKEAASRTPNRTQNACRGCSPSHTGTQGKEEDWACSLSQVHALEAPGQPARVARSFVVCELKGGEVGFLPSALWGRKRCLTS